MKIKFIGATESVTGSKHLLITEKGKQYLLDCGLYQGMGKETDALNRKLDIDPGNIEAVVLSHAHVDHSGNLPTLVKSGFNGKIYCTPATFDVCKVLLLDSAHIHESDIEFLNKRRRKKGESMLKPLYTVHDAENCLKHFRPIPFETDFHLCDELAFRFTETGHIIGSAAINITAKEKGKITKLTFTGDVGRYVDAVLRPPLPFPQSDYIICESTYGNRLHDPVENAQAKLLAIIKKTCIQKQGRLIIPAFSLGRTQEILYTIDKLRTAKLLPEIRIFVDSPLSSSVTGIVKEHPEAFNDELKDYIKQDPDPFGYEYVRFIESPTESKMLNEIKEPCIIISASGMCDAGRVKHHLRHALPDQKNTVLIAGYCAPNTLGARLVRGEKKVHIYGEFFDVKAEIETILSFSAHADYRELLNYLACQEKAKVKSIFLVHGDPDAKTMFKETLEKEGFKNVVIPLKGEIYVLY
ncbi:MAG: MBL fold metallo-hydrolase RNA specificity domain-containing protein [Bacteroidia bacterium]